MSDFILSDARLTTLETKVGHVYRSVDKIEDDIKSMQTLNLDVARSLSKLTVIAEQNSRLGPRIDQIATDAKKDNDKIGVLVRNNEKLIWKALGGLTVLAFVVTISAPFLLKHIS